MSTKGASNQYGNARGGKRGHPTPHTGFAWAKGFNKSTLQDHFNRHGNQVGCPTKESYAANAVHFANTVDRENCVSFVDSRGSTYKFNKKTNEFAIITSKGIVVTYFKPTEGYEYFINEMKERAKYGKRKKL